MYSYEETYTRYLLKFTLISDGRSIAIPLNHISRFLECSDKTIIVLTVAAGGGEIHVRESFAQVWTLFANTGKHQ